MPTDGGVDIYTIGHSTRSLEELVGALRSFGIWLLVDIRLVPRSRHVPQSNQEVLAEALPAAGIDYLHMKALGGWRKGSPDGRASARGRTRPTRAGGARGFAPTPTTC